MYNPDRQSMHIYGTVIHELAHASHWNMVGAWSFNFGTDTIVVESWARGVQWELTRMVYPNYNPTCWRAIHGEPYSYYTGVVKDMIDGRSGYDQVSGYTIRQIEDALDGSETWNEWITSIKNSYENETEENLDDLFDYWN